MTRPLRGLLLPALLLATGALGAMRTELTTNGVRLIDAASGAELAQLDTGAARDAVMHGATLYVALARGGIAVIDVSNPAHPATTATVADGVQCGRLILSGDSLLCVQPRYELLAYSVKAPLSPALVQPESMFARPLPLAEPASPVQQKVIAADVRAEAARATVLEVSQGRAVIDAGTAAGFREGRRVKIISQKLIAKPDLSRGGVHLSPSGETVAVVSIEQAEDNRAMARLGRGDWAQPGDLVELSDEPLSERLLVPRRAPFAARAGFFARPFLGLEGRTKPFGILADAFATYYFESVPLRIEGAFAPMGLAAGGAARHYPTTFVLTAAYTTDFFEIGLGAGGLLAEPGPMQISFGPLGPTADGPLEINSGFTINQLLRLGALDGINVLWQSSIFSRPQRFVFGVGRAELNVPLTSRLGLFGGGGGGENGWAMGELGVRTYVNGTGATGTVIISASLGYASIFDGWDAAAAQQEYVSGPAVAFGMEWRL